MSQNQQSLIENDSQNYAKICDDISRSLNQDSSFWKPISNLSIVFDKYHGITTSIISRASQLISLNDKSECSLDKSLDSILASLKDNVLQPNISQQSQKDATIQSTWVLTGSMIKDTSFNALESNLCPETQYQTLISRLSQESSDNEVIEATQEERDYLSDDLISTSDDQVIDENSIVNTFDRLSLCMSTQDLFSRASHSNSIQTNPKDIVETEKFETISLDEFPKETLARIEGRIVFKGIGWVRSRHQPWMFIPTCILGTCTKKTKYRRWMNCISLRSCHVVNVEYVKQGEYSISLEKDHNPSLFDGKVNTRSCSQEQCIPCIITSGQGIFARCSSSKQWKRAIVLDILLLLNHENNNQKSEQYMVTINKIFARIDVIDSKNEHIRCPSIISFRDLGLESKDIL